MIKWSLFWKQFPEGLKPLLLWKLLPRFEPYSAPRCTSLWTCNLPCDLLSNLATVGKRSRFCHPKHLGSLCITDSLFLHPKVSQLSCNGKDEDARGMLIKHEIKRKRHWCWSLKSQNWFQLYYLNATISEPSFIGNATHNKVGLCFIF